MSRIFNLGNTYTWHAYLNTRKVSYIPTSMSTLVKTKRSMGTYMPNIDDLFLSFLIGRPSKNRLIKKASIQVEAIDDVLYSIPWID